MKNNNMYLVGSNTLKLSNCKDVDYINIIKDKNDIKYHINDGQHIPCDIFNITIEQLSDRLKFKDPDYVNIWLYQYDYRLIGDDFPIHFDVLKHKDKIIQILKKLVINHSFCFAPYSYEKDHKLERIAYHIMANIFFIENNNIVLLPKQKEIIQSIHDLKMPKEYYKEMVKLIEKL